MDNFDYKKYLSNNPLTEAYTPGEGWIEDFEYDDMLAHGLTLTADTPLEDLQKVVDDFEDVNYHREAAHLFNAIDAINDGNRGEAKMYINKFRKEIKTTLAGWDDVNEAESMTLTADQVEMIAQSIADEFTAEDSELDLKYVITPGSIEVGERGAGFDLDVEAGPNTPGAEWKDERGFSIANYLGDYAGGSFYIKDGKVFNAANRNSFIANASDLLGIETPGEETDYMQRRKEMDDYAIDENKETKNTKMKKSELKEMIKAAIAEGNNYYEDTVDEGLLDFLKKKKEAAPVKKEDPNPIIGVDYDGNYIRKDGTMAEAIDEGLLDFLKKKKEAAPVKKEDPNPIIGVDYDGNYIRKDGTMAEAMTEAEDVEVEDNEEVDVDIEKDIEIDDVENESDIEVDSELAGEDSDVAAILGLLTKAQEEAKSLGDEKLMDQIGNTITYYTRAHVVAEVNIDVDIDNPAEDAEIGMELEESISRFKKLAGIIK